MKSLYAFILIIVSLQSPTANALTLTDYANLAIGLVNVSDEGSAVRPTPAPSTGTIELQYYSDSTLNWVTIESTTYDASGNYTFASTGEDLASHPIVRITATSGQFSGRSFISTPTELIEETSIDINTQTTGIALEVATVLERDLSNGVNITTALNSAITTKYVKELEVEISGVSTSVPDDTDAVFSIYESVTGTTISDKAALMAKFNSYPATATILRESVSRWIEGGRTVAGYNALQTQQSTVEGFLVTACILQIGNAEGCYNAVNIVNQAFINEDVRSLPDDQREVLRALTTNEQNTAVSSARSLIRAIQTAYIETAVYAGSLNDLVGYFDPPTFESHYTVSYTFNNDWVTAIFNTSNPNFYSYIATTYQTSPGNIIVKVCRTSTPGATLNLTNHLQTYNSGTGDLDCVTGTANDSVTVVDRIVDLGSTAITDNSIAMTTLSGIFGGQINYFVDYGYLASDLNTIASYSGLDLTGLTISYNNTTNVAVMVDPETGLSYIGRIVDYGGSFVRKICRATSVEIVLDANSDSITFNNSEGVCPTGTESAETF